MKVNKLLSLTRIVIITTKLQQVEDIQITKIRNADFDYLYDENEFEAINEALIEMNWASLAQLFYDERIDRSVFLSLEKIDVFEIMKDYPVGVRIKFFNSYVDWKSSSPHANENDGIAKKEKYDIEISLKQILKTEAGECFLKTVQDTQFLSLQNKENYLH
ncbi:hypothetical protein PVAND_008816 [Polypedilum vanderplanki]|uniref:Uncharacterized protein n=1 Tax=Polypedilum vanderplanki TaxID=319348 RepID=A0A9J6CAU2_POLVA|nr:hypothetical protein PVAND_008816 [Polypedilum vanderplanki]